MNGLLESFQKKDHQTVHSTRQPKQIKKAFLTIKNKNKGIPIIKEKYQLLRANTRIFKKVGIQNDFLIV